jgi:hypothetical protein
MLPQFTPQELATEEWRPAPGYEADYHVSSLGRVKRISPSSGAVVGRILKPLFGGTGYLNLSLSQHGHQQKRTIHRLVAFAFCGTPPRNFEVNHKDGNKINNRALNLEWVGRDENCRHAYRLGLTPLPRGADWKGDHHPMARLTRDQVGELARC